MVYKKDSSQSCILTTARMRNLFMPQLLFLLINAREGLCSLRVYISRGKIDAVPVNVAVQTYSPLPLFSAFKVSTSLQ